MKFFICLLALVAVSTAQNNSCKINIENSGVLEGEFYGSIFSSDKDKPLYESIVGRYIHLINDTGDLSTTMTVTNETIFANNGTTGKLITSGWVWSLTEGKTLYTKSKFGGVEQPCVTAAYNFNHLSDVFHSLKTLFPVPGIPADPNIQYVCMGGFSVKAGDPIDAVMSIEYYHHSDNTDKFIYFSQLTNTTQYMSNVHSFIPLSKKYAPMFANPCKHQQVSADDILEDYHGYVPKGHHGYIPKGYHGYVRRVLHNY